MQAFRLHIAEPQEIRQEEERRKKLREELEKCTQVKGTFRNKIYPFLAGCGIHHLTEIDYPLRLQFKAYARQQFLKKQQNIMINAFDRIRQQAVWEEQKTLPGRQKYKLKYENELLFLKYLPDREIAEKYILVKDERILVWDFRIPCAEKMKQQVFRAICSISREKKDSWERKLALAGLKCLYQFCIRSGITDIEMLELEEKEKFLRELQKWQVSENRQKVMAGIVPWIQRHEFLEAKEIHWQANVWYLERIHISKERINQSNPAGSLVFEDVKDRGNRELLKKYMRYLIAVSDLSISNVRGKSMYVRNFLKFLDEKEASVDGLSKETFEIYINRIHEKGLEPKSFNAELLAVTQFYNFLLVRGEVGSMPYQPNEYIQKNFDVHHDRSVEADVSMEIISKLKYFPEHLRLMYLHLWGIGLRASEVCALKGNAYEWDGRDAWIRVWQPKMRKYKRVPIPEMLYRLMKVYIKKYDIGAEDYLFPSSKGETFRYGTFRAQMIRYCEGNQIHGGEYIFRSHDYRHNVATEFYDSGVPLSSVRDYHGHTYDEMTLQYVDHMPERVERAAKAVFWNPENNLAAGLLKASVQEKTAVKITEENTAAVVERKQGERT